MSFVSFSLAVIFIIKFLDGSRNTYMQGSSQLSTLLYSQLLRIYAATNRLGGAPKLTLSPGAGSPASHRSRSITVPSQSTGLAGSQSQEILLILWYCGPSVHLRLHFKTITRSFIAQREDNSFINVTIAHALKATDMRASWRAAV